MATHTPSYSDLQAPVCELTRLSRHYSSSWEEKGAGLRKLRDDYERKQRQLNIALKRIEMMAAEVRREEGREGGSNLHVHV